MIILTNKHLSINVMYSRMEYIHNLVYSFTNYTHITYFFMLLLI